MRLAGFLLVAGVLAGQNTSTVQVQDPNVRVDKPVVTLDKTPVYKVTVVSRTAKAINYRHRSGATKVDFEGTSLLPDAHGEAKVESKKGYIEVEVEFKNMRPATQFGAENLTYVLWAISPEGRATNLGELLLDSQGRAKVNVTTELQAFAMIVTAEPYFAVSQPSNLVVMDNIVRKDTQGKVEEMAATYELLERGQYPYRPAESVLSSRIETKQDKTPIELWEARNAVQIARWTGADKYAGEQFQKASGLLQQAEDYERRKQSKPTAMIAREAAQTAEDARMIAVKRMQEEQVANERRAAAEREAEAARKTAEAEDQQRVETARRAQAEQQTQLAERATREAEAAKAAAIAQQQALAAEAEKARLAKEEAERARIAAESDREKVRQELLSQLNAVLETRDTARGLIVNMSDVLFDTGRFTLRPAAREKLAKVAGIVLSHPTLKLEVEGHTDSVGGDEYNQGLSEQRASSVRDYLVSQGLPMTNITARGFGKTKPVASNDTPAGRQQNRRVELVVSGDVIGAGTEPPSVTRRTPIR
jgi:outer membrane protein OmpA-like peptidoglycan-associated protein